MYLPELKKYQLDATQTIAAFTKGWIDSIQQAELQQTYIKIFIT
jgi:hypothetical protein